MIALRTLLSIAACAAAVAMAGCAADFTHVKPGQSARQYLAEKNAPQPLVPVISPATTALNGGRLAPADPAAAGPLIPPPLPDFPANPQLPDTGGVANRVADAYLRGSFAMQAGQNEEAITALEEAVKLDPNFTDAWTKLVKCYERTGNNGKAADAYKKLKKLGQPNGSSGGGDPSPGLGLLNN